jgi:hypothetical protein
MDGLDARHHIPRKSGQRALGRLLSAARECSHPLGDGRRVLTFLPACIQRTSGVLEEGFMGDILPPRRGLDSLKKEAKRWLDALHANAPDARGRLERTLPDVRAAPTLRDVQHALAREHGFPGWAALKQALEKRLGHRLELGESLAAGIAIGCEGCRDPDARAAPIRAS